MPDSKRSARVVIGANFGDEGKGLLTDYHASKLVRPNYQVVNVRFNGGAQAGHTVVTPEGKHHIFSHFGSGTLVGATTFLSRHFVVNPTFFKNENTAVRVVPDDHRLIKSVWVSPDAPVACPYDRLINEVVEHARGDKRHGSVGVGINETLRRSESRGYLIRYADLSHSTFVYDRLDAIARGWVPDRLRALGFADVLTPADAEIISCLKLRERWFQDCSLMRQYAYAMNVKESLLQYGDPANMEIIFEGAQGLLLDQNNEAFFPHVTPSNTGLKNVIPLAEEMGVKELDVTYVTRCYLTRHGAGPLPFECAKPYEGIIDETNLPHKFQGDLRFAPINIDLLKESIAKDLKYAEDSKMPVRVTLAVTCIDHLRGPVRYVQDQVEKQGTLFEMLAALIQEIKPTNMLLASGPTRNDIKPLV